MVSRASFRLVEGEVAEIKGTLAEMRAKRREAQPSGIKTFGSTFKNPADDVARRGADRGPAAGGGGVRGLQVGGARFSDKHANFVENAGGASTADILALMAEGRRRVHERFGVCWSRRCRCWATSSGPRRDPPARLDSASLGRSGTPGSANHPPCEDPCRHARGQAARHRQSGRRPPCDSRAPARLRAEAGRPAGAEGAARRDARSRRRPTARPGSRRPASRRPRAGAARAGAGSTSWRRRALLMAVVSGALAVAYFGWLRDSSLVAVRDVEVEGVSRADHGRIAAALTDAARGMTTLHVQTDQPPERGPRVPHRCLGEC